MKSYIDGISKVVVTVNGEDVELEPVASTEMSDDVESKFWHGTYSSYDSATYSFSLVANRMSGDDD